MSDNEQTARDLKLVKKTDDIEVGNVAQKQLPKVALLGFTVALPLPLLGLFLCCGVVGFSIIAAFMAETAFQLVPGVPISSPPPTTFIAFLTHSTAWLLTTFELGFAALLSMPQGLLFNSDPFPTPALLRRYVLLACYYVIARLCTNYVVDIADYPTQVLVKSAKIIPVMIVGVVAFNVRTQASEIES